MTNEFHVFISSKMQELAPERQVLHTLLPALGNDLIHLRAWTFESDAPATDASIREVYLNALKQSALYIGLFWNQYGEWTVDEFERATEWGIDRHIYVKNVDADQREGALSAFLEAQSDVVSGITPKWFTSLDDLREQIEKSITIWLQDRLTRHPGDQSALVAEFSDDLPALPKRLIGRDVLLGQVRAQLEAGERVLLQGFGGMGKSALAAWIAGEWLDDDRGRVVWLRAGSEDADALFEALVRPFGAQQALANTTGNDKLRVVRQVLTDGDVSLVVLDDVWNGTALNQVLRGIPRKIPVLITARQRYALDQIFEIGRLDPADALTLLSYHAGQPYVEANGETRVGAQEVCHQLGYHAFALEVAGKTIKVDRITPRELLARIAAAPHAIAMPEDFAEEGRTSITELLTASVYALDDEIRRVFWALGGLFVPRATPGLVARCMDQPAEVIEEALTTLQRRGLAERVRESENSLAYFQLHDLAFSYARQVSQRQVICTPATVIAACHAYTLEHETDLNALDAEMGNILGAADAARSQDRPVALIEIMRALCGPYLSARGHTLRFMEMLDSALVAAEAAGADHAEARLFLLGKRGNTYYDRGQLDDALRCYHGALALAEELGLRHLETLLLCNVSKVLADQDDENAGANFERAYQIASELEDLFLVGYVLEHQGYYAQARADYAAARGFFAEEVALAENIDDPETAFFALLNLGSAEYHLGEFTSALTNHQRALALAETHDNHIWMAYALQSMGEDHHRLTQHDTAQTCFRRALQLFREGGMQSKIEEVEAYMREAAYPIPAE